MNLGLFLFTAILFSFMSGVGQSQEKKLEPREEAIQADIDFLTLTNPELKEKKPSDFIDTALLREIESEGFFAHINK